MSGAQDDRGMGGSGDRVGGEPQEYVLRLYVTGTTPKSQHALAVIKDVCETHLQGRYELQVIDIYQDPQRAQLDQIVAIPTLVKELPAPLRKFVGDMSDREKVLVGLDIVPKRT